MARYSGEGLGRAGQPAVYREIPLDRLEIMPDRGCEVSPKCIECPLPVCKYDLPPKQRLQLLKSLAGGYNS